MLTMDSGTRPFFYTLLCATIALSALPGRTLAQEEADAESQRAARAPAETAAAPQLTAELLEPFEIRFIGPSNMSGRITDFAVPDMPGHRTIYASMASGGVWKTVNLGTTWQPIFTDQAFSAVSAVEVAPSNPEIVWVGTGERNSLRSNDWGNGVYKSTDGGETWEHMGLEETMHTGPIIVHPENPAIVYVAGMGHLWGANPERGIFKTTNGGETWEKILFVDDTTAFVDLKMHPTNPEILYAAGWHRLRWGGGLMQGAGDSGGIWKTTDGGESWVELTAPDEASASDAPGAFNSRGLPTNELGRIGIGVSPAAPNVVYAIMQVSHGSKTDALAPFGGLFRSTDAGESWDRVNDLSAVPDYYYNEIWVDPNDADHLFLGQTRLMESKDGGISISVLDVGRVHVDNHAMWIDPGDSEHIVLGNDGGVYITWDGGRNWEHQLIPASQFYEVDVDTTKVPYHVCGGTQDNGTWCGPSRTRERVGITAGDWYSVFGGDGFHSAVSPDSAAIRFGESQYGNIERLNTTTWEYTDIVPYAEDGGARSSRPFEFEWNTPFIISHHDPTVLYVGGNFLFKLTQRGRDWETLGPDMTRANRFRPEPDTGNTSYHTLHSIGESLLDPEILWTGANDGLLWVSRDGGQTWTNVTENLAAAAPASAPPGSPERCKVAEIEPSRHETGTAFVVYDCHKRDDYHPYVFETTDFGATWTDITGDLPEDAGSYVIRQDAENPDLLYVGNARGLYVSIHGGGDWIRLKNNLPTVGVRDMELVPQANELVVGTYGYSMYILDINSLQELTDSVLAARAHLFPVEPTRAYNRRGTYGSFGDDFFTAPNPPYGAVITYYLREDVGHEVTLTIRKGGMEGDAVITADVAAEAPAPLSANPESAESPGGFARSEYAYVAPNRPWLEHSAPDSDVSEAQRQAAEGAVIATLRGSGRPGIHQIVWELERDEPRPHRLGDSLSRSDRLEVLPGTFTVQLRVGETTMAREIVVKDGWVVRRPGWVR